MSSTQDNEGRFAPPQAHVADIRAGAGPAGIELASRGSRLGATLVDCVIHFALIGLISAATPFNIWALASSADTLDVIKGGLASMAFYLLVQAYPLVTRGQTVGKIVLKQRIVRPNGARVEAGRLLGLRYLLPWAASTIPTAGMVYALVDCLFIFRASRRTLHDLIADTVVVRT